MNRQKKTLRDMKRHQETKIGVRDIKQHKETKKDKKICTQLKSVGFVESTMKNKVINYSCINKKIFLSSFPDLAINTLKVYVFIILEKQ